MYKEVTIDPACMAKYEYYALLKLSLGFDEGRYASVDNKSWSKEAMQFIKNTSDMTPVKEKSVKNFLNKVRMEKVPDMFLVDQNRKKISATHWNEWRKLQEEYRPFSVCISESNISGSVNHDAILEEDKDWKVKPISVDASNADDIIKAISPLLNLSKELTLIDPYFRLSYNKVFDGLLELINNNSITKFTVVSTIDPINLEKTFQDKLKTLNINKHFHFEWIRTPEGHFHDRLLITDVGAITAGHGFMTRIEKGTITDKLNLSLITKKAAQDCLNYISILRNKDPDIVNSLS